MQKTKTCNSILSNSQQSSFNRQNLDFTSEESTKDQLKKNITRPCNGLKDQMSIKLKMLKATHEQESNLRKQEPIYKFNEMPKFQMPPKIFKDEIHLESSKKIGCLEQAFKSFPSNIKLNKLQYFDVVLKNSKFKAPEKLSETSSSCQSQGFWILKSQEIIGLNQQKMIRANSPKQNKKRSPTHVKNQRSPKARALLRSPSHLLINQCRQYQNVRHLRILSTEKTVQKEIKQQENFNLTNKRIPKSQNQSNQKLGPITKVKLFSPKKKFGQLSTKIQKSNQFVPFPPFLNRKNSQYKESEDKHDLLDKKNNKQTLQQKSDKISLGDKIQNQDIRFNYYAEKTIDSYIKSKIILNKIASEKNIGYQLKNKDLIKSFRSKQKHFQERPNKQVKQISFSNFNSFKKTNTPKYQPNNLFFSRKNQNQLNQVKSDGESKLLNHKKSESTLNKQKSKKDSSKNIPSYSEISLYKQKNKKRLKLKRIAISPGTQKKQFQFYILKKLAQYEGTYVYVVLNLETNSLYVLKSFQKNQDNIETFIKQSKIQFYSSSTNLVSLYGIFEDQSNLFLLMEYLEDGNLFEQRKSLSKKILESNQDENKKKIVGKINNKISRIHQIAKQTLQGVAYLHSQGIIHRDIKSQNIFVSNGLYKIGDFGSSTYNNSQQFIGTVDYAAPQIIQQTCLDQSIDIWSLGCVFYENYVGYPPFYDEERIQTYRKIVNVQYNFSKIKQAEFGFGELIDRMLRKNSSQRISAQQALNHKFITQISKLKQ